MKASNALHFLIVWQVKGMGLTRRTFAKNLFVSSLAVPILTLTPQTLLASVTYVVKSGDTLSRIAQHNGTTVAKIKQLNRLSCLL